MSKEAIKELVAQEIASQLATLKSELSKQIKADIRSELSSITTKLNTKIDETCTKITEDNKKTVEKNQLVPFGATNALATLSTTEEAKLSKKIETKIMKNIAHKYDEKIGRVLEWNSYQQQDTDHMVTSYQKAVLSSDGSNRKLLTGGGDVRHILSEQVSLAFTYDDDRY